MHAYLVEQAEPRSEEHHDRVQQLERRLTGAVTAYRRAPVVAAPAGVRMPAVPSWWTDDEDASASSLTAMQQM